LTKIGYAPYFDFIKRHFEEKEKQITDSQVHEILRWTEEYTFYTHFFCNTLFNLIDDKESDYLIGQTKLKCLKQFENGYYSLRKTLPLNQWKLLEAIAQEQSVTSITGKEFLSKYKFSASSVYQAVNSLQEKQLVSETISEGGSSYAVYDVFFERWVQEMR
jgi:hypothetical protein